MLRFKLLHLFILLVVFLSVPRTSPTRAQNPIQISDQGVESKYRQLVTFHITATSTTGKIVHARLLRLSGNDPTRTVVIADKFVPASTVELKSTWDVRTVSLPPWQFIRYSWEISDDAGNTLTTSPADGEYVDTTHPWKTLTDNKARVYWYAMADSVGKDLLQKAQKGYSSVAKAMDFQPEGELRIVLFPNHKDYLSFYAVGTQVVEEWIGGQAYGRLIVLWYGGNYSYTFQIGIPHEIAHSFLFSRLDGNRGRVPVWFNEGQAMNNQSAGLQTSLVNVGLMARRNKLFRLNEMENYANWGTDLQALSNWYDEAASLVNFLFRKYGPEILGRLLKRVHEGERFEQALKNETGWSLLDFEIAWRESLGARPLTTQEKAPKPTLELPGFRPTPTYEVTSTP